MTEGIKLMHQWIDDIAEALVDSEQFEITHFSFLDYELDLVQALLERLEGLPKEVSESEQEYSACLFAFDICVIQMQAAAENGFQPAKVRLEQLMTMLAHSLSHTTHYVNFWLPLLNAFYEVHIELSDVLKDAYVMLASAEDPDATDNGVDQLEMIREMIADLSDLSDFDIAQHFFAQSHAMPSEFYFDLLYDLFAIDEGHDIAILTLMHPKAEVRAIVIEAIDQVIDSVALSSKSLSRLQVIMHWYPDSMKPIFERWIKSQRRQGVVFEHTSYQVKQLKISGSEIDADGVQVLYLSFKANETYHACNILLKHTDGVKEIWFSSSMTPFVVEEESVDQEPLVIRKVDLSYCDTILNHFLALSEELGHFPDLRLLQLKEYLGLKCQPEKIDIDALLTNMGATISPVTQDVIEASLAVSGQWPQSKDYTAGWYIQSSAVDATVNQCCQIEDGAKVCDKSLAVDHILSDVFEQQRDWWCFYFAWHMLWLAAKAKKNERTWRDCFFLAYEIHQGRPLDEIPVMVAIAEQTVDNSLETMQERGTHLSRLQ